MPDNVLPVLLSQNAILVFVMALCAGFVMSVFSRGIVLVMNQDWEDEKNEVDRKMGRFASITFIRWLKMGGVDTKQDAIFALGFSLLCVAMLLIGLSPFQMFFVGVLYLLSKIDFETMLLPDVLVFPLLFAGLLLCAFTGGDFQSAILGTVVGYLSLWALTWGFFLLTGKVGMGEGDFKLFAAVGAWLGVYALLPVMLLASFSGLFFAVFRKTVWKSSENAQPFGPFIAIGAIVWLFAGKQLIQFF